MGNVGRDYLACSATRKLGSCTERQSIRRAVLEEAVLKLLRDRLTQPDAVAAFITSMTREINARRGAEAGQRQRLDAERAALCRKLDGLYDAIATGLLPPRSRISAAPSSSAPAADLSARP